MNCFFMVMSFRRCAPKGAGLLGGFDNYSAVVEMAFAACLGVIEKACGARHGLQCFLLVVAFPHAKVFAKRRAYLPLAHFLALSFPPRQSLRPCNNYSA